MKIYIIAYETFDYWLTKNNLDKEVKDLSDDEFIAICNKYQDGWSFNSWDEYIDAFNRDSPYAPVPSHHYIRVVEEKKAEKFKLNIIFGEEAADEAADYGYKKTAKKINLGKLDGSVNEYEFDSEKDRDTAIQMLNDADGWLGAYWEKEN
jgi:hypothetical protein